ncbi:MAG TPA: hypothetical protein VGO63_00975 [Candidatus Paceibacterota bacterium]|jgi:hypothetical protein|nr:hypothetical protein [Candidatus Paceibacterota bacterium]
MTAENFITIETHFGVPDHYIRANTRNKCSEDLVAMLQEMSKVLYPNEEFEIFLLPSEPGSYKDIIKFIKKNKIGVSLGTAATVAGLVFVVLNYKDSHEEHLHEKNMWVVDDTAKCLELKQNMEALKGDYDIENIPDEKLAEVCGNLNLKKKKNNIYDTLQRDNMIKDNETLLKDSKGEIISSKKIVKEDFPKYIEPILDKKYSYENANGIIELISPVVKQKREGRGISWRGTYFGENIVSESVTILTNGEDIDFYMQDPDFKDQTYKRERTFASGDNMKVIFDITGDLKGGILLNRSIYIREVESYNEDIVFHKERVKKQQEIIPDDQSGLFDNLS